VLDLGCMPLANALLAAEQLEQPEPSFPLELVFCPSCTLLQLSETVSRESLFSEYPYFSSFSDTMLGHARCLVDRMAKERSLGRDALAIEVASNDGYLLQYYVLWGVPVLGIEPAANIAKVAEEKGIRTLCRFFNEALAEELAANDERGSVVHAHNVLAHVDDLNGFVRGLRTVLRDDGIAVVEVPYVRDMIAGGEFDTIYHEHLCYFSLAALSRLFSRHRLTVTDVERVPIHGGSLRVLLARDDVGVGSHRPAKVSALLAEERAWEVEQDAPYRAFGERVEALRRDLMKLFHRLKENGQRVAAYGASAKGNMLLNYFGIGRDLVEFVADRSPAKQGRFTPGTHLPIVPPTVLVDSMPDYALLLCWNLVDEIVEQQQEYLARGGHFIVPIPELKVVGA
jgi:SAM-dependent methyltransferase